MTLRRIASVLATMLTVSGCAPVGTRDTTDVPAQTAPAKPEAPAQVITAQENPKDGPCIRTTTTCIALNPDVSQETLNQTLCMPGYTKSVRPSSTYTHGVKARLLRESGIDPSRAREFELDHIVPLALGGHPRKLSNLQLQPWDGEHGAHRKDKLEVRLQRRVCSGRMTLTDAQICIAQDWEACDVGTARPVRHTRRF